MVGIAAGKTWSRIGPEVAPTDSAASGVWTLQEYSENQAAGTWPSPVYPVSYTGGTTYTYGSSTFVKFTSSGTLTLTGGSGLVDYLIVGGGGAGGFCNQYNVASGGGGGGGGIAYGFNYHLDYSIKTTFAITIAAGGVGGGGNNTGGSGGNSKITGWGLANGTSNFDFAGGTSYATTGGSVGAAGAGGGGRGGSGIYNVGAIGTYGSQAAGSNGDWASGGAGGGGGGWSGYASGSSGYGGNAHLNTNSNKENIATIKSQNPDGSVATHTIVGRQNSRTNNGTEGMQGVQGLGGDSTTPVYPPTGSSGGDLQAANRGFFWNPDGRVAYGSPGAGGRGNYQSSTDGGGRGVNQGGPINALDNQGGGGAGAGGANGGTGGSGIVIIRFQT